MKLALIRFVYDTVDKYLIVAIISWYTFQNIANYYTVKGGTLRIMIIRSTLQNGNNTCYGSSQNYCILNAINVSLEYGNQENLNLKKYCRQWMQL